MPIALSTIVRVSTDMYMPPILPVRRRAFQERSRRCRRWERRHTIGGKFAPPAACGDLAQGYFAGAHPGVSIVTGVGLTIGVCRTSSGPNAPAGAVNVAVMVAVWPGCVCTFTFTAVRPRCG